MKVLFNAAWKSDANINVRLRAIQGSFKISGYRPWQQAGSKNSIWSPIMLIKRLDFRSQHLVVGSNHVMFFLVDGIIDNQMLSRI
jgi:hypothetical protein